MSRSLAAVLIAGLALGCEGEPTRPPPERAPAMQPSTSAVPTSPAIPASPAPSPLRDALVPHLLDAIADPTLRGARSVQVERALSAFERGDATLGASLARPSAARIDDGDAVTSAALDLLLLHAADLAVREHR